MTDDRTFSQESTPQDPQENHQGGVWFLVEHRDQRVEESCLKLAAEARALADKLGQAATGIILGSDIAGLADLLAPSGTDSAVVVQDPHLETYAGEAYAEVLAQLADEHAPAILLLVASTVGNDLAPRVAAKLGAAFVARCTEIEVDRQGALTVRRAIHGGNAQATLLPVRKPLVATIDPQILSEPKPLQGQPPETIQANVRIGSKSGLARVIDYLKADPCAVCVSEAEIVIGVGKGLQSAENIHAVEELARVLGASIGGSRRATDERWIADERRIGLTGKTIAPRLYLICGISGAFHHTLSIKECGLKVVINTDATAPISKMADLVVVGDMQQVIPELTQQLRQVLLPAS